MTLSLALFVGAAVSILAGASFNAQGREAETALFALGAGLLAFVGGAFYRNWRISAPLGAVALLITVATYHFAFQAVTLRINLAGLLTLFLGGALAALAYTRVTAEMRRRLSDLEGLNQRLAEQHRVFLAATEETANSASGVGELAANTARQTSSPICCFFVTSADGQQFIPQPGFGVDAMHVQPIARRRQADPLTTAIEARREFSTTDPQELRAAFGYLPADFRLEEAIAVPIPVGEHVGGFVVLANKPGGYSADDRRLAATLAMRAGAHLASMHAVAVSRKEAQRYALLNDLVKQASGLSFDEVVELVLDKGKGIVRFDSARVAVFGPNDTFTVKGGSTVPVPIGAGMMSQVREGRTVLRRSLTGADGLFSGLEPPEGHGVSEALVPIRGKSGVLGAICIGRNASLGFTERDLPTLDELGTMAGVAVENSHILEQVSGQASKLDTALNALGEISQALTSVTEGADVLEHKTLESATRLFGVRHALMTRAVGEGRHSIAAAIGFGEGAVGSEIRHGQGVIGAVMLSGQPLSVADLASAWDVQDPNLTAAGIRSVLAVPMREGTGYWGTLSVFDVNARNWSDDDLRVLSTLGNEAVVAVRNAELYDSSKRMIWELGNLHEGLKAVTSTLELDQVLEIVLGWAARAAEAQIGALALLPDGGGAEAARVLGAFGTDRATAERLALGLGGDICRDVIESGKPVMEHMDGAQGGGGPLNPRAVLCVPILLRERPTGLLFLAKYQAGTAFNEDHRRLVSALAAQAAIAIDNAKLFQDRQELFLSSLRALANAVDARDPYTAGHSRRVTEYSKLIARQMSWEAGNREAWRKLEQGGLLHDIGKIAVPDAILAKPGRLTDAEFEVMKSHPSRGWEILRDLTMLTDELKIVRSHHERFDGKGYPDRLGGDQLPIYVWIVSAADAFDAMTSDRPYRRGMSLQVAVAEVEKGAGAQFHPEVARAVVAAAASGALTVLEQESQYRDAPALGAFENPVG